MATTKSAMLMIKLSSSYVLIITTPSTGFSEWVGARPPATRVNTLFFCKCPGGSGNAGAGYIYKINLSMGLKPPVFLNFMLWSNDSVKLEASILLKSVVINLSRVKRTERMVGSS